MQKNFPKVSKIMDKFNWGYTKDFWKRKEESEIHIPWYQISDSPLFTNKLNVSIFFSILKCLYFRIVEFQNCASSLQFLLILKKNLHERDPKLYSIPKLKVNLVILAKRSPDHNRGILYIVQKLNEITFQKQIHMNWFFEFQFSGTEKEKNHSTFPKIKVQK